MRLFFQPGVVLYKTLLLDLLLVICSVDISSIFMQLNSTVYFPFGQAYGFFIIDCVK